MEENKDITEKSTTDHDNNVIKPFPNTPGTRQEGASVDSTTEVDQIVGFNSNENENPAKCPPCSVDNVVIENIPTPEMVRRHRES